MSLAKYALAAPFATAIHEWVEAQVSWRRAQPFHWIYAAGDERARACRQLAERARLSRVTVERVYDGTLEFLTLRQADRLALALDIPLRVLAEEFKERAKWIEEMRRQEKAAA